MRRLATGVLFLALANLCACGSIPNAYKVPLRIQPSEIGPFPDPKRPGIAIEVHDPRGELRLADVSVVSDPDRLFFVYGARTPADVSAIFQSAARGAADTLGFGLGTELTLDLTIQELRVDLHARGTAQNLIGYGVLGMALKSSEGVVLRSRTAKLAYWEDTRGLGTVTQIGDLISRIYRQAAWEATVGILLEQYPDVPEAPLRAALALSAKGDDAHRREAIFWIGLLGSPSDPSVESTLLGLFRTGDDQSLEEAAAEAIGMVRLESARPELDAVLAGKKKLSGWDHEDTESVWYLLKALENLGATDLARRIPPGGPVDMRSRLVDLLGFLATGQLPAMTPQRAKDWEEGRQKLELLGP